MKSNLSRHSWIPIVAVLLVLAILVGLLLRREGAPARGDGPARKPSIAAAKEPVKKGLIMKRALERKEPLDKRGHKEGVAAAADRVKALDALRKEVPGVEVDFDAITGAPKHIMAAGKFLARGTPGGKDPLEPVREFIAGHEALFGHGAAELAQGRARVMREDVTAHNGMRTVVWQQEVAGVPVFETILKANLTKNGDIITLGSHFMRDAPKAAGGQAALVARPPLSAPRALAEAVASLGGVLEASKVTARAPPQGAEQAQKLAAPGFTDTTAHLSWVPMDESTLRLAWQIETFSLQDNEMFRMLVDAEDGKVLVRQSLTADLSNATYRVFTSDSPSPFTPGHSTPSSTQPAEVARTLVTTSAANTTASPEGWIPDGQNQTVGNNVDAHLDLNADNVADTPRPQGSPSRVFDFTFNSASEPTTYRDASVMQLFYYNNWIHDRVYELGFTESAGNFQTNNFGRGGSGNDAVQADAQDGSGTNNANFSTPSDGSPGRMQMYIWPGPAPDRDSSFDGDIVVHEYGHGVSNRLVGGGVGISAWQSRGMGEGWSDFYAMSLLSEPADNVNGVYAMGGYSTYLLSGMSTNYYFGIRRYPYCTDMTKAPLTYRDIDPTQAHPHTGIPLSPRYSSSNGDPSQYHAQGEVWCNMLMECRANIINHHGWAAGNELMLRIVTDGLKLTPANPTFIQSRDAIIQADLVNNGGANAMPLWAGFAKRGIGSGASGPANSTTTGVVESYQMPDDLSVSPADTLAATGVLGGPFSPASRVFTLQNTGSGGLNWTASVSQPWLTLSRASGVLTAGATDTVTLSFSAATNSLPVGTYSAVASFTNTVSGVVIQRNVSLVVEALFVTVFAEPFNSSTLASAWTVTGTGPYRAQVTALNAPRASNHLTMDTSSDGVYARNEATLTVNLASQNDLELHFWAKGFGEDSHGPPASPFINGADFDGVAMSADGGTTWWEIQSLRGLSSTWTKFVVDLDAAIAARGISYTANFKIRFNQYDNYGINTDGIAIDDILIGRPVNNTLALSLPAGAAAEGASALTATLAVSPVQTSDLTVSLSASNGQVTVPATVTVPSGTTQVTFPVTIVDDALLDGSQTVALVAEAPTFNPGGATLTVHDDETTPITVDAPLNGIEGSSSLAATVSTGAAVDAPVTFTLESSNPEASIPASVTIPAGQSSTQFFITLANDPFINGSRSATFTANVTGWTAGSDTMTILDDEDANLVLALTVPAIAETDGLRSGAGRVSINGLAQSGLVIGLASGDTGELTAPATVTIPAGATQALFDITAVNDPDADGPQSVALTASASGFTSAMLAVTVHDDEAAPVAWNPRPAHLSTSNPVTTDLAWSVSEGNLIVNGDFETGDLSGWAMNSPGGPMFRLQDGFFDPPGSDTPTAPHAGGASMIFAPGSFSGIWSLWQDVVVPPDGPAPVLQWMQRVRNTGTAFTSSHQYRVEIRDAATDAVLATPFVTVPGSPLFQDWAARSADLSPWRGRSVRVAFVVMPNNAILNVLLDDITLQQRAASSAYDVYFGTNPAPGPSELLGNTASAWWALPNLALGTTYYWQVVTKNGAQTLPGPVWQFSVPAAGSVASFAWSSIASPQSSNTDIPVTITALDALGNTASGFTGMAALEAVLPPVTQPSVLVTEFSAWSTDEVEFTNVTSGPVDVSGWKVMLTQFNSFPAPYLTFTIPSGTTVPAGGIFRVSEGGTAPGVFPSFRTGASSTLAVSTSAFVVLKNARDEVVDFLCVAGDPRLVTVPLPPEAWTGSALPGIQGSPASQSYQRIGTRDNNNAADWQFALATPGTANTGLTLPLLPGPSAPAVSLATTAAFTAGEWSGNVRVLGAAQNARLRARESGGKSGESGQFTVTAAGGQLALAGGTAAAEGDGTLAGFGTVTLPSAAASAVTVSFIVSGASQASVADVTIPAGATSAGYDLTVVDDAILEGAHSVTITAVAQGCTASAPQAVTITDNEGAALTVTAPASATEGQGTLSAAITITSAAAPVNDVSIALASSDTTEATVPATVVLPAGQTSVTANLTIVNDALLDGARSVTLTASAGGFTSGTASLTVNDNESATITLAGPATIWESAGVVPSSGTVTLGGEAPADVMVSLASSDTGVLTVPATVTVPAGQSSATFAITVVDDSAAEANASVTLTASAAGLSDGVAGVTVRDDDLAAFGFASIASPRVAASAFPITVSALNTSGDVISGFTGAAALAAPGNTITPAATGAFTAGAWTGNVTLAAAAASQTITATSGAATGTSNSFAADPGTVASFAIAAVASPQTANVPFTLTATARDLLNQDITTYAGPARLVQLGASQLHQVGSFASSTTTSQPLLTNGYNRGRAVILVRGSELGGARQLTSLGLHVLSPPPALSRLVIRAKATTLTTLTSGASWDNAGWQTVHDAPLNVTSPGWADFAFSSPYFHNGASNLLVEVIHSNTSDATWSATFTAMSAAFTSVTYASVAGSSTVNADPALWTGTTPAKGSAAIRPLLRFASRVLLDASSATLAAFTAGTFSGPVSAPYGGTGQALGVWDVAAGALSFTNEFTVSSAGTLAVTFLGSASEGGPAITGTVTTSVAPVADMTVSLSTQHGADLTIPASVTIPAGMTSATFPAGAVDDALIEAVETVTVSASGAGYDTGSGSFTIADNDTATLSVTLPASVTEGGAAGAGTLTASASAPFGVTVNLSAAPAGRVTVPASVTLLAGETTAAFSITAVNNTAIDGTRPATVTASATGWTSGSGTLDVLDNEALTLAVSLGITTPREGSGTVSGTVALTGTTAAALTVDLASDDTSEATVPASVTIAAGASSAAFTMAVVDDALTDGAQPVTLTATAAGFTTGTRALQVLDNDVAGFGFAAIPNPQVRNTPFAVAISALDVNGAVIPTFTGTTALSAAGSGGAVAMTPSASGAFVNGAWTGSVTIAQADTAVVITADGDGGLTGASAGFNVLATGALTQFAISGLSAPRTSGTPVSVTVTAQDAAGNTVTGYTGAVSFSATGPSSAEVVAGTGTGATATVLGAGAHDSRNQSIFAPAEVGAARTLRSLALDVFTVPGQVLNAFTIRMKHTAKADYSAAGGAVFETTGWTTVYQASQTIMSGWNTFAFQNGFAYDGASNLMVDISFNNSSATTSGTVRFTTASASKVLYSASNSFDGDPLLWNGSTGPSVFTSTLRMNARFSGFVPVTVTPAASGTFSGGAWTGDVTFASSGSSVVLRAVNGAGIQGQTAPFALNGSVLDHFDFAAVSSPQAEGAAVPLTITAKDVNDMPVTGFTGSATLGGAEQPLKAQTGSGTSTWSVPLGSQSRTQRMQVIYTAAEAGGVARTLAGLDLNASAAPGSTLANFTIRMKHTALADFTAAGTAIWESNGWTTVFQGDVSIAEAGWVSFPFSVPFAFDGARNLMVDFSYNNAGTGAVQGSVRYTASATNRTVLRQTDVDEGDPLLWSEWTAPVPTLNNVVPNARFASGVPALISPATTGAFAAGVWSGTATVSSPLPRVEFSAAASGRSGTSNPVTINPAATLTLALAATVVEGSAPLSATVTRSGDTSVALTVSLASTDTTEATVSSAAVTIPAGSASAAFSVNAEDDAIADGPQAVAITASAPGHVGASAALSVTDNEPLALLVSLPPNLSEAATAAGNGVLRLNRPAPSALTVTLSSNDTTELTVPSSVAIAAGAVSATFAMTVVNDTLIDGPQTVTVSATAAGCVPGGASTVVQDNEALTLSVSPASVMENAASLTATLSLTGTAANPVSVTISVNDSTELLVAPNTSSAGGTSATVTIPAGASSTTFALLPQDDAVKDGNQSVTLALSAAGLPDQSRFVTVVDDEFDRYFMSFISSPQMANAGFNVSVFAYNISGSTITTNNSALTLGAAGSAGAVAMTPSSVTLSGGFATFAALFPAGAQGVSIIAADGLGRSVQSSVFDVLGAGGLSRFAWGTVPSPQLVESPIGVTVTAKDAANNTLASYAGSANLKAFATAADTTIGAGTTSWSTPLGSLGYSRTQGIYLAAELGAAKRLTGMALNILTSSPTLLGNFTIRLKHTSATSFSTASWDGASWTTVFSGSRSYNATGWQNTVFTRPFDYDGASNLLVDISFANSGTGTAASCQASTTASARSVALNTSLGTSGLPTTWSGTSPAASTSTSLLNVRFTNATPLSASGTGPSQVTVGTGTGTAGFPLGTFFHDERTQMIYTAAELGGAMAINSVALDVSTVPGQVMNAFTIRMKNTSVADYSTSAAWESTGWTTVYSTAQTVSSTGWVTFNLTTPFAYNGTSNLMVDISFNNSFFTSDGLCRASTTSTPRAIYAYTDSGFGDPLTWTGTSPTPTISTSLPNMRFGGTGTTIVPAISPASTGVFASGSWSGAISSQNNGASVFFAADDPVTGIAGYSNAFAINQSGTLALSFLGSLTESSGTVPNGGTLTLSAAPASNLTVSLSSASPAQMTVPATVTVLAGQTSVSVPVTVENDTMIEGPHSVAVTAAAPGYARVTTSANIADNDGGTFTITAPASVSEGAASFIATLNASAASLVAVTVSLSSNDTTELSVPGSVTLPANATSAGFIVTVVNDTIVDGSQNATLTASAANWTSGTATVAVTDNDPPPTLDVSISGTVNEGGTTTGYIYLPAATPSALTVTLASGDTSAVTVPATVTVPAGSSSTSFTITAPENTASTGTRYATVSASAPGYRPDGAIASVLDNDASRYAISNIAGTPVAGTPVSVTITAQAADGSTLTSHTGTANLSATSSGGAVTVTVTVTPAVSGVFSSGVWTGSVVFGQVATGVVLTATNAQGITGSSNAFVVTHGPHSRFGWTTIASPKTATTPFASTITAQDSLGNPVFGFTGTAVLSALSLVTVGSGTSSSAYPLNAYYDDVRSQMIFTAAEMGAARDISFIALDVVSLPSVALSNFTVRMKQTSRADYASDATWDGDGWTICLQGSQTIGATGWNTLAFTTPFSYDGSRNVMVDISFNNASPSYSSGGAVRATTGSSSRMISSGQLNYSNPLTWSGSSPAPSIASTRPNIRFGAPGVPVSPTVTGSFAAGVWSGDIALAYPASNIVLHAASGAISGNSNSFNVASIGSLTLGLAASIVEESGGTVSATLSISAAQGADLLVALASSKPSAATVPPSVNIPAGQTSVTFPVTVTNDTVLEGSQVTTLTASVPGFDHGTADLTVLDDETTTVTLVLPGSVAEGTSTSAGQASVHIAATSPVALSLALSSSAPGRVGVPAIVTIPAGQSSASFTLSAPNNSTIEPVPVQATIAATLAGSPPATGSVQVADDESHSITLSLFYASVSEGAPPYPSGGYVYLPAPVSSPLTVNLSSSDASELLLPATAVIAAGANSSPYFTLTPVNDSVFDGSQQVTAVASAPSFTPGSYLVTVLDDDLHHLSISGVPSPQVRNAPFAVAITAKDVNDAVIYSFDGAISLSANDGITPLTITPASIPALTNGSATISVVITDSALSARITATDPVTGVAVTSNAFTVGAGVLAAFAWDSVASVKEVDMAFPVTLRAMDAYGNVVTNFNSSVTLGAEAVAERQVGTDTLASSYPFYNSSYSSRSQFIYLASEVGVAGSLRALALNVTSAPSVAMSNFTIRLRHTPKADYVGGGAWETAGWTTVYQGNLSVSGPGWHEFAFTTPFAYNGTDNLMVDFSYGNGLVSYAIGGTVQGYSSPSRGFVSSSNYSNPIEWGFWGPMGNISSTVPNVRFITRKALTMTPATTGAGFVGGVWNGSVSIGQTADAVGLSAISGSGVSGWSNFFAVVKARPPLASWFEISGLPEAVASGQPVPVTLTARDANGALFTGYAGIANLAAQAPGLGPVVSGMGAATAGYPSNGAWVEGRAQIIYPAAELGGRARRIVGMAINVASASSTVLQSFKVRVKHTTHSFYFGAGASPAWDANFWANVYSGTLSSPAAGWLVIPFTTAFDYDGTSGLMVDMSYDNAASFAPVSLRADVADASVMIQGGSTVNDSLGAPTGWAGATPALGGFSVRYQAKFLVEGGLAVSPERTGAFTNGSWSGLVNFSGLGRDVVLRAWDSSGRVGLSSQFSAGTSAPSMSALPAFTGGTAAVLQWSPVGTASAYQLQSSLLTDFSALAWDAVAASSPVAVGGLSDGGNYKHRVRSTNPVTQSPDAWSQRQWGEWAGDSHHHTSAETLVGAVALARLDASDSTVSDEFDSADAGWISQFTALGGNPGYLFDRASLSAGPNTTPPLPINQGGDLEARVTGTFAYALTADAPASAFADGAIEGYIAPETLGSSASGGLVLRAGIGPTGNVFGYRAGVFFTTSSTAVISLSTLPAGLALGTTANLAVAVNDIVRLRFEALGPRLALRAWKVSESGGAVVETPVLFAGSDMLVVHDSRYGLGRAGLYFSPPAGSAMLVDDVSVTRSQHTYLPSGHVTSPVIAPGIRSQWGALNYTSDTSMPGTSLAVDVLDASGNVLASGVASGTDLSTLAPVMAKPAIRLRARLASANALNSPLLRQWAVAFATGSYLDTHGPWSNIVSSIQDASPPVLAAPALSTSASFATLTGTAVDATSGVASVAVSGSLAATSDGFSTWNAPVSGLLNGANAVSVSASDNAVPPNLATVTVLVYRLITPAADSDGDGISDLLEHAFTIPMLEANPRAMLPIVTVQTDGGSGQKFLTLDYRRRIQRAGLTYAVETSTDMATWTSVAGDIEEQSVAPVGDGLTETVRVRISPALGGTDAKFVRLKVTVQ